MTLITPLAEQELNQLEESILQNGILNPVIVTKDYVIIDGHNRYAIAKKHNLSIPIKIMNFANRNDTELWIIKNQFGRRNLSAYDRSMLALKLKLAIAAKAKENGQPQAAVDEPKATDEENSLSIVDAADAQPWCMGSGGNQRDRNCRRRERGTRYRRLCGSERQERQRNNHRL